MHDIIRIQDLVWKKQFFQVCWSTPFLSWPIDSRKSLYVSLIFRSLSNKLTFMSRSCYYCFPESLGHKSVMTSCCMIKTLFIVQSNFELMIYNLYIILFWDVFDILFSFGWRLLAFDNVMNHLQNSRHCVKYLSFT